MNKQTIIDTQMDGGVVTLTLACGHKKQMAYGVWRDGYKNFTKALCIACTEREQPHATRAAATKP